MPETIWRPFTQMRTAEKPLLVSSARDEFLRLKDGRDVVDAISSWWVITHGHCQPEIVEAIREQAARLDQVIFANFSHEPAERLAETLLEFLPDRLRHVFFSDNGSTSVEVALKMALQACRQQGRPEKTKFLAFSRSYHGDTVGAMSVGGRGVFTKPYAPLLFDVIHAGQGTRSSDAVEAYTSSALALMEKHREELAGVILEPLVQGAGGMIVWPVEAVRKICARARELGLFLIFDEVMTGFGRTGSLFAFEQIGIAPDLLCLSKGLTGGNLPLALTVASPEIYDAFLDDEKSKMFFHGHSFTGNPISCAAALANLRLLKKSDLSGRWRRISEIHRQRLESLPLQSILDRRIRGTIAAVELKTPRTGYESDFAERATGLALKHGVFLRPLGNILYVLPPYCISDESLHRVWDAIEKICLDSAAKTE